MTSGEFVYWLAGMFEGKPSLTPEQQLKEIQNHLSLCLTKVTPSVTLEGTVGTIGVATTCEINPRNRVRITGNQEARDIEAKECAREIENVLTPRQDFWNAKIC